jgi:hypothetical protein
VTKPVLWLPQNEIANSPSTPLQLTEGPFAGQMLFGDVTYGGVQRAHLEKVGGEYQGAVFRLTQGLEAGVTRISVGPDGALYAGGLGAGGNWGQEGKLSHGLQKLTPNGGNAFDIRAMRAVPGGFALEYTKPLSTETAAELAKRYRIKQWRYVPTAEYGGPKVDEETLAVQSAALSDDRRTVTLSVPGLKADRVVHVRSPRPFSSSDGESLWSTEAWYTLNRLPGTASGTGEVRGVNNKCLDVADSQTADGTQVQIWTCNSTDAQKWTVSGGTVKALGKCLDVSGGGTADGTTVPVPSRGARSPTARSATRSPASASTPPAAPGTTARPCICGPATPDRTRSGSCPDRDRPGLHFVLIMEKVSRSDAKGVTPAKQGR